jgi:branched-chain amino acid transport system permease protein
MSADQFVQYLLNGLTDGSIYALIALGFTIIYAVTRIINFAQGEFVMLGGMLSYYFFDSHGYPLSASVILSILVGALSGAVLYLFSIRPARRASVVSLIIITIGAAIFIRGIAGQQLTKEAVRPPYFTGKDPISFLDASIAPQAIWIIGITIAVTILIYLFLNHTMVGKALKACAINPRAAGLVGIDVKTMALTAFVLAAIVGAIIGAVMAPKTLMAYNIGAMLGLKGFIAASIGGFKSPIAAVLGGIMLGVIESLAVAIDWGPFSSSYKDLIAIMVLLLILLVRSGKLASEETAG